MGAVAIGAVLFNFIYWNLAFIRISTAGLAAQASGAGAMCQLRDTFLRAAAIALTLGGIAILLQWPIREAVFALFASSDDIESKAQDYIRIRIWGAPAYLMFFATTGWLVGRSKTGAVMALSLLMNGLNIVLSVLFVVEFGWGVRGVAFGTLISEWVAAFLGLGIIAYYLHRDGTLRLPIRRLEILDREALRKLLIVNRDYLIRTVALSLSFFWFTNQSAAQGDVVLAANQTLLQFMLLAANALDGPAMAAEGLVGQAIGAKARRDFDDAVRKTTVAASLFAVLITAGYFLYGDQLVALMSADADVRETAQTYMFWAAMLPIVMVAPFQMDGVFIGALAARDMRDAMLISLTVYIAAWAILTPLFDNHGLWAAFMAYLLARGVTLWRRLPKLSEGLR